MLEIVNPYTEDEVKKKLDQINALLLDFDGTLVNYEETSKMALRQLFQEKAIPRTSWEKAEAEYDFINNQLWGMFEKNLIGLKELRNTRFQKLIELYDISETAEKMDQIYLEGLINKTKISKKTMQKLKELKESGFKLFIVTNGIHIVQERRIIKNKLLGLVEGFVTSETIEKPKPHKAMFLHAIKKVQSTPSQTLMVGDSYKADIIGAERLGIKTCIICPTDKEWKAEPLKPMLRADTFNDFANYLLKVKNTQI